MGMMMRLLLLLLLFSSTLFAQRTPLRVNNTIVDNPNFVTGATALFGRTGANISVSPTNIANAQIAVGAAIDVSKLSGVAATATTISTTAPLTGGGDLSANRTLAIPVATGSADGYLSSADWTTFNNKSSFTGTAGTVVNTGTPVVGQVPLYTDTTGTNIAPSSANAIMFDGTQASRTWTFDLSGTDVVQTYSSGALALSGRFSITPSVADTTALTVSGGSTTGSGTTKGGTFSHTANTSGNIDGVWTLSLTDTASGASTFIMKAFGGASGTTPEFGVTKTGKILAASVGGSPQYSFFGNTGSGMEDDTFNNVYIRANGARVVGFFSTGYMAIGSAGDVILGRETAAVLQMGNDAATATAQKFKAHDGSGTDKDGANFTISGGQSTGTGAPGKVLAQRSSVGTTGSSVNAYGTAFSLGGNLSVDTTTTGNVGAGEDNLITYSVPAGQLSVNGDYIEFDVAGSFAADVNTKRLRIYFGSTVILDTTALVLNGLDWRGHGKIIRTGAATQKCTAEVTVGGTLLSAVNSTITDYTTATETLSGAVTFKCTGEDSGGVPADNAVVQQISVVKYYTAP